MKLQALLLLALCSSVLSARQARILAQPAQSEPLVIPAYNMTKAYYMELSSDTTFNNDYLDYGLYIYNQYYAVTTRVKNIATGNLSFTFDVNQTFDAPFGPSTTRAVGVQGSALIQENVVKNINVPEIPNIEPEAVLKVIEAYINNIIPTQISLQVLLPEKYVNYETMKTWNPLYSYRFSLVPDISLKFHNFITNLTEAFGIQGKIQINIDAYSPFLSYTTRYRGKPLILSNVTIPITLSGDVKSPSIYVDPVKVKPFSQKDVLELVKGFYTNIIVPAVRESFSS